jgi:hypothetical protein
MDVNSVQSSVSAMKGAEVATSVSNFVLKKAINLQAAGALALVEGVTSLASNLPPHLGQNVNTVA